MQAAQYQQNFQQQLTQAQTREASVADIQNMTEQHLTHMHAQRQVALQQVVEAQIQEAQLQLQQQMEHMTGGVGVQPSQASPSPHGGSQGGHGAHLGVANGGVLNTAKGSKGGGGGGGGEKNRPTNGSGTGSTPRRDRAPKDGMRQLICILVRLFPSSQNWLVDNDGGGGNLSLILKGIRVSQISMYLEKLLGHGPQPDWGVPQGWHLYVAHLLSWASGRHVSSTDAMDVVIRPGQVGCSYELNRATLERIGIDPTEWELPLSRGAPAAVHKR